MSEYQYYEFVAIDSALTTAEQAEVRQLSTRAQITATSFTNEYHWGNFRGDPRRLMERYYDAHLYLANWGTHHIMLRLPRSLLDPKVAERYCVDPYVSMSATRTHVILSLTSEDESGEWVEGAEDSLSAIAGVRAELAAGDLRALYLAWLSAHGTWEYDEDVFDEEVEADEDLEPPVPAGLGSLSAPQRALADFLRLDADLLDAAAQASPALTRGSDDPQALTAFIAALSNGEKNRLLGLLACNQSMRARTELLRSFRAEAGTQQFTTDPRRTVADLLDTAAARRRDRERQADAERAAHDAILARQRAAARDKHLDELARDPEATWADTERLINTKTPAQYDKAVNLLKDLRELARRDGKTYEFRQRITRVRDVHRRKPSLISRLDNAGLT